MLCVESRQDGWIRLESRSLSGPAAGQGYGSTESAGGTCAHTQDLVSVRNSHTLSKKKKEEKKEKTISHSQ